MEISEIITQNEKSIRQALKDYGAHTCQREVLCDISDRFIKRLAEDSTYAKQELRELFSKSPVWDSNLQALVINGTRTHNPDPERIRELAAEIFRPIIAEADYSQAVTISKAIEFFASPFDESFKKVGIGAINTLAPKAYAPTKKPSRVFKAICDALGISDDTAGSRFQRLYAQFADELSAKKISFKLFVSINPAHFVTMSNPKGDERGSTLTSCHSFNSTEYSYNIGCSGYARDNVSFIVFTVADPANPETFNNRKTTRQIFAYKPGNGLLLQSRLYNTSGGTRGAQEESKLYRDLIQREIAELENAANLWKTFKVCGDCDQNEVHYCDVEIGEGFGGYPDWQYGEFDARVSIRTDHAHDYETLKIGTYGLCVNCGSETSEGQYCEDCKHMDEEYCDCCGEYVSNTHLAYDRNGYEVHVCDSCLEEYYSYCDMCHEYHENEVMHYDIDGEDVCDSCFEEYCTLCDECGEYHQLRFTRGAVNSRGENVCICDDCYEFNYRVCPNCDQVVHEDLIWCAHDSDGNEIFVCEDCIEEYMKCDECGGYWPSDEIVDGLCPECRANKEMEESA